MSVKGLGHVLRTEKEIEVAIVIKTVDVDQNLETGKNVHVLEIGKEIATVRKVVEVVIAIVEIARGKMTTDLIWQPHIL